MRRGKHRFRSVGTMSSALLLLGAVAACGGDDDRTGEPVEVFTFADDELCAWITADEVAGFFASVYEWEGTAEVADTSDPEPDGCSWQLTSTAGDGSFEVIAGNMGVLLPVDEVVEFDGGSVPAPGGTVSGHPALSEGVVVQNVGWGVYAFWVPPGDDHLSLWLSRHAQAGVEQARLFTFADQFLRELGWVS